ncbi:MAG: hypothetical protein D3920_10750 [Candidatus Electrothrix sp. AW2]|nr:hypothetical protein [Candidatus Electrothrix gigas]
MPCYRQIRLQDINLDNRRYSLHPFRQEPEQTLLQSISTFGILHPPLVLEQQDHTFIVLSGKRRIEAYLQIYNANAQENQQKKDKKYITALTLTVKETANEETEQEQLHLFTVLLQHQLLGGPLTPIEQAIFFQKAAAVLEKQNLLSFLPLLGLKPKPHIPGELISLLDLNLSVQQGIHEGRISQRSGKKLVRFSTGDQEKLADIIHEYQLGGSKQQKLLERCFQLTKREQISVKELLDSWCDRIKEKNLNGPQKTASLLRWLDQQYQPRLTKAEKEFKKFSAQLQLPVGVRLEHSLSFEEEQVTLHIDFSRKEELTKIWPKLEALLKQYYSGLEDNRP